ncbi:hypothetical protein DAETH_15020 [Deinococcus aetherius]|uniref:CdiI C-terminal domain-containing protein n=1 Tax=Deinococcus aetherius TaxID=200252 RepID=A0ABM8ACT9_9DEIO|nr:hypothetical protein DAETH_15020 [Deinococcus aetherius]
MFDICLLGKPFLFYDEWVCRGVLRADGFEEEFDTPLTYWNEHNYVEQWCEALRRLIEYEQNAVALVTSIRHPDSQNFVFRWILYREGDTVFIQQHVLFAAVAGGRLSSTDAQAHIHRRNRVNEEGYSISEWPVSFEDVGQFLGRCEGKTGTS